MLNKIRKIIPKSVLSLYHKTLALLADFIYRSPSDKLIVIGVTGTSGKSTVIYLLSRLLEQAGFKVGVASTIVFKVGKKEWLNDKKMTMIGRFALQKLIFQMTKANCQYAIIETTSQGIEQFRHAGINYDILVFTNLYPEHIEAHGGFENYKAAKVRLFRELERKQKKLIAGQKIQKTIIVNLDDEHADDFLNSWADVKYGFTLTNKSSNQAKVMRADQVQSGGQGTEFRINQVPFRLKLLGRHNVYNALAAVTVGLNQSLSLIKISQIFSDVEPPPGRIEFIDEGQNFQIVVDYAFEPVALEKLYEVVRGIPGRKIIHVLGSTGGGRDVDRRPKLGRLAGQFADYVIVTNEDPYDEDPQQIISQVAAGALKAGKKINRNLFKISDRRKAIAKALGLAQRSDIVLVTGKGSEQAIVVKGNKKIPWDDRKVIKEELVKIKS